MDFKYHLGSSYSKCGSVDHEHLSPLGVQNCSPTPAETDLNLQFNKILCWFSVWEVLGKISDSLICLWLTIRSTFLCYSPVGMYAHTHSNKSPWNSFHPLWGPVWYLLFRLSEILMNQWNNFIVWCADCKRSLESRGAHSRHYWHFKPGSSWLWVCWPVYWRMLSSPPGFYPLGARGNPFSTVMTQTLDVSRSTHGAGGTKITAVWEPLIWMIQRLMLHINKGALRLYAPRVPLPPPSLTSEKHV